MPAPLVTRRPSHRAPNPLPDLPPYAGRLLRGAAFLLLSVFSFYLKVLSAVVRFGIKAVKQASTPQERAGEREKAAAPRLLKDRT